jgi:hypothetical protein
VIDLGLRLADVQAMNLQSEPVEYSSHVDPRDNIRSCGASEAECNFLVRRGIYGGWRGDRVELNAMTSDQFIAWLERKLADVGVKKVVPNRKALEKAYRRAVRQARVQQAIDATLEDLEEEGDIPIPENLAEQIHDKLDASAKSWDQVLWDLVDPEDEEATADA